MSQHSQTLSNATALMIHGAGGGGWEFRFWEPAFVRGGFDVLALDLAASPLGLENTNLNDYLEQAIMLGSSRRPVLVGASMGAAIAMLAVGWLDVRALILVVPAVPGELERTYPQVIRWAGGAYSDTVASMPEADDETVLFAHERWRDESGRVLNEISMLAEIPAPRCPTLVIVAEDDEVVSADRQLELADRLRADRIIIPAASHLAPLLSRRAAGVAEAAVDWLLRNLG